MEQTTDTTPTPEMPDLASSGAPAADERSRWPGLARRNQELEALYTISTTLAATPDFNQALKQAVQQIMQLFGFSLGVLRMLNPSTGELSRLVHVSKAPQLDAVMRATVRVSEPPFGLGVRDRSLVMVENLAESPYSDTEWARQGARTFVGVPLLCRGMVFGCVNFTSLDQIALTAPDQELIQTLVNHIAMAVANSELFHAAQRKIAYLSALHECSRDIGAAPDLQRVLRLTVDRMAHLLQLERTLVLFWDPTARELEVKVEHGFSNPSVLRPERFSVAELPAALELLRQGQVWLGEAPGEAGILPQEFVDACGMRSVLLVPLVAHDEVLGLLIGDRDQRPLRLSSDETDLAMIFANQAAVWLASARLLVQEQRARAEAETAEMSFRDLLELAPDAIVVVDHEGTIRLVNTQTERMFGYTRSELLGSKLEMLMPHRYRDGHVGHRDRYLSEPRTRPMGMGLDLLGLRKDGTEFPVEISLSPTLKEQGLLVTSVIRDITERKQAAQEREMLLASEQRKGEQLKLAIREAHHRIKNNLQAISDLLYLELSSVESGLVQDVLRESVERIQSIALVHDLLSQEVDVQTVDARAMVERLVEMVVRSGALRSHLVPEVKVPAVPLSSKKATTLALILNELVSNAAKHAFNGRPNGRLSVRLEESQDGLQLQVQDDGPGLPMDFDFNRDANVGLQVVRTLAERDLSGKFTLSQGPGLTATVWFPW